MWWGSQQPGSGGRTDGWSAGTALPPRCQHARPTSGNFRLSGPCQGIFKNLMTWARLWKPYVFNFLLNFQRKGVSSLERCLFSDLPSVLSLLRSTVSFVCSPIYRQFCLFSYLPSVLSVLIYRQFCLSLICRQICLFSYLPSVLLVLSFTVSFVTVSFVTLSFVCSLINRQFCLFSYLLSVWSLLWFSVSFVSSLI